MDEMGSSETETDPTPISQRPTRERRRPKTFKAGRRKGNRKKDEGTTPRRIDRLVNGWCIPSRQPKVEQQANNDETGDQGRDSPPLQIHDQPAKNNFARVVSSQAGMVRRPPLQPSLS